MFFGICEVVMYVVLGMLGVVLEVEGEVFFDVVWWEGLVDIILGGFFRLVG